MSRLKKEVRVLGIDDGPFDKFTDRETIIIGTFFRGGEFLDGILSSKISIDGMNSTSRIIKMVNSCKFHSMIQCIFLDGITMGGFNVIDIRELCKKTKIPVIVIMRTLPDQEKIFQTLSKLGMENKIKLIEKAGPIKKIGNIFVQLSGIKEEAATEFINLTTKNAIIPEPIRIAHIIASGVVKGESYGQS